MRGLPDIVRPSSKGTDIVSRIERSRKERYSRKCACQRAIFQVPVHCRHDSSVNDLHSELSSLSLVRRT